MDRARAKLGDKVTIPAVVEEIEHTTLGEINYKVVPLNTWFDADEIEALGQTESEDCISRADLLGKMKSLCPKPDKDCADCYTPCDIEDCIDFVVDAPSVVPTERTGAWIRKGGSFQCPVCGEIWNFFNDTRKNFCPNCGAKMGGDTE